MNELENGKLKAAITTLQRPDLLSKRFLEGEPIKERTYSFPVGMTKEEGAELMIRGVRSVIRTSTYSGRK